MNWKITYYDESVENRILNWPDDLLARYLKTADLIQQFGPNLGMPFTKPLGKKLFEIRVKTKSNIGRVFFCYVKGCELIVVHSLIKKTQKTPKKEIEIALKRAKEISYEAKNNTSKI